MVQMLRFIMESCLDFCFEKLVKNTLIEVKKDTCIIAQFKDTFSALKY